MAARWFVSLVSGLAFVCGLVNQMFALAIGGLLGLAGAVAVYPGHPGRPGRNPLAETYRDVRPFDRI
jgi:hypothetical protein